MLRGYESLTMRLQDDFDRLMAVLTRRFGEPVVLSGRSVSVAIGAVVAITVIAGALLIAGLIAGLVAGPAGPPESPPPDRPTSRAVQAEAPEDPGDPRTAGYAGEVIATALTLGSDELQRFLRLHTTDQSRQRVDDSIQQWQAQLPQSFTASGTDDAGLWVTTVGQRTVATEAADSGEIRHLILVQDLHGGTDFGTGSEVAAARVLVSVAVFDVMPP